MFVVIQIIVFRNPAFLTQVLRADGADKGIIPLTCSELFERVKDKKAQDANLNFTVEVSYIEVYALYHPHFLPTNNFSSDL